MHKMSKKKACALLMGLTLGVGSAAVALPVEAAAAEAGADSFSDVPQGHWAYDALDMLAKDGIIEGYPDGTFQGGRTMTRYEMASIVAKATQNGGGSLGGQAVLEKMQREFKGELHTLKQQVDQNTQDIKELKKEQERVKLHGFVRTQWDWDNDNSKQGPWIDEKNNNRFYLNLLADLKVSDVWTAHFQSETNQRYARNTSATDDKGHTTHVEKISEKDWGTIQRIWVTGNLRNGMEINLGRRWAPLGQQFSLLGATVNGVDATMPVTKDGLRVGGFYYNMAEYDNADFSFWGPMVKGKVGKNLDVFLAYAHVDGGRKEVPYTSGGDYSRGNWTGKNAFVISASTNIARNLRLTADYVRTDYSYGEGMTAAERADLAGGNTNNNNQAVLARLDYKWTNPAVKGSFGAYLRYHYIGRNGTIWNDDSWGSIPSNSRGWTIGVKYVPWKNVEWENMFEIADCNKDPYPYGVQPYKRHLFRTQLDFHF